ncbi:MAG: hypothetical protein WCA85_30590 [Paraburkholderia sp.]
MFVVGVSPSSFNNRIPKLAVRKSRQVCDDFGECVPDGTIRQRTRKMMMVDDKVSVVFCKHRRYRNRFYKLLESFRIQGLEMFALRFRTIFMLMVFVIARLALSRQFSVQRTFRADIVTLSRSLAVCSMARQTLCIPLLINQDRERFALV